MNRAAPVLAALLAVAAACTGSGSRAPAANENKPPAREEAKQAPADPGPAVSTSNMIRVAAPLPHAQLGSPLRFSGEARGPFFFEGSFPVLLRDRSGAVLARGVAKAQGEWMTENFVPFAGELSFEPRAGTQGVLLFKQDDPSDGESKRAPVQLEVPVQF